ncbi:MAG: PP0621 family protein [Methylophilaceae bacterium]
MGKILLLALAIWLIITVLKRYGRSVDPARKAKTAADAAETKSESMVQCANCGVHLPKSDSLLIEGQYFCCEAHSKQPS